MPLDDPNFWTTSSSAYITNAYAQNIVVACGKGIVTISLSDGKVTLTDCALDEGARAWWKAVEQFAPMRK